MRSPLSRAEVGVAILASKDATPLPTPHRVRPHKTSSPRASSLSSADPIINKSCPIETKKQKHAIWDTMCCEVPVPLNLSRGDLIWQAALQAPYISRTMSLFARNPDIVGFSAGQTFPYSHAPPVGSQERWRSHCTVTATCGGSRERPRSL